MNSTCDFVLCIKGYKTVASIDTVLLKEKSIDKVTITFIMYLNISKFLNRKEHWEWKNSFF